MVLATLQSKMQAILNYRSVHHTTWQPQMSQQMVSTSACNESG